MRIFEYSLFTKRPFSSPAYPSRLLVTERISASILRTLSDASASNVGDIAKNGIYLAGGASLIFGLDSFIAQASGMDVHTMLNAEEAVAIGAAKAISLWNKNKNLDLFDID